jgi:4-amino-4-deoxy-L-arabinose transferase-like glycosyltransferase
MGVATQENVTADFRALRINLEFVAYAAIFILAFVLRVAELDTVPLSAGESRQALAIWRVLHPDMPGSPITPESPLLFLLHAITFTALGASEFSVRIFTAFGGILLVFSPLLFRDLLGRTRAILFSLLLAFSPIALISARFDSSAIWAMLCAITALWALWRYGERKQISYTGVVSVSSAGLVLLTDPAGFVLALILIGAGFITLTWARADDPDSDSLNGVRKRLSDWTWQAALGTAVVTIILVSTGFALYLPGLSNVSELALVGVRGILTPLPNAPLAYPVLTLLFYEPILLIFGIATIILLLRRGTAFLDRFFIGWLVFATFAGIIYRGAGPDHALWLIVPLAGLVSSLAVSLLEEDRHPYFEIPWWSKPVLALAMIALLAMFAVNFQGVARNILSAQAGALDQVRVDPINAVWATISVLFIGLGFFLVSSLWGIAAALRGGGLGLLIFGMVTSMGSGWGAAVTKAESALELWHTEATGREVFVLRDTLDELARRETRGVPRIPLFVLAPEDGVIAWTVRDYTNTQFITDSNEARTQEIALLPMLAEPPDLGGAYVGQDFVISRGWNLQTVYGLDVLSWWMQRRTRFPELPTETMVLWLRQDIYDGVPFEAAN